MWAMKWGIYGNQGKRHIPQKTVEPSQLAGVKPKVRYVEHTEMSQPII